MGSCCSSDGGGREAVGGAAHGADVDAAQAVDQILRSRGDFFSSSLVEVRSFCFRNAASFLFVAERDLPCVVIIVLSCC